MKKTILSTLIGATAILGSGIAAADQFEVTITNLTSGIQFTPVMVTSHQPGVSLFTPGTMASPGIEAIAEGGDISVMSATLGANPLVTDIDDTIAQIPAPHLLNPGASVTVTVDAPKGAGEISIAAMMLPTNDGFIALNGVRAPRLVNRTAEYTVNGYDAGTEPNDELCINIPGPVCGGEPFSPGVGGEDFIHIHNGIHGVGDLAPATYDWNNPVATVSITRVK